MYKVGRGRTLEVLTAYLERDGISAAAVFLTQRNELDRLSANFRSLAASDCQESGGKW
jgi:hypothetical protein